MKAIVKQFHSPDADLTSFTPKIQDDAGVLVQMMIGPRDQEGEESFDVVVCTPEWLRQRVVEYGPTLGRHYLVVERWDWPSIREYLVRQVERESDESWHDLAAKLGRIGKWEFDDYQEWGSGSPNVNVQE